MFLTKKVDEDRASPHLAAAICRVQHTASHMSSGVGRGLVDASGEGHHTIELVGNGLIRRCVLGSWAALDIVQNVVHG
jgi:hypothetical protein